MRPEVLRRLALGQPARAVSRITGVPHTTVRRWHAQEHPEPIVTAQTPTEIWDAVLRDLLRWQRIATEAGHPRVAGGLRDHASRAFIELQAERERERQARAGQRDPGQVARRVLAMLGVLVKLDPELARDVRDGLTQALRRAST